jgi:hypothetical protein
VVEIGGQLGDVGGEGGVVEWGSSIWVRGGAGIGVASQEDVSGGMEGEDGVEIGGDGCEGWRGELGIGGGGPGWKVGKAEEEGAGQAGGGGNVEPEVGCLLAGVPLVGVGGEV